VVALYHGAIDSVRQAERCIGSGDIVGRSKAVNKALGIITELLISLDHAKGGEISRNLKRLYSYMQVQLLDGHAKQKAEPISEVAQLLSVLLEGWEATSYQQSSSEATNKPWAAAAELPLSRPLTKADVPIYGAYFEDAADARLQAVYSY
jgi:flagellar protein FliS